MCIRDSHYPLIGGVSDSPPQKTRVYFSTYFCQFGSNCMRKYTRLYPTSVCVYFYDDDDRLENIRLKKVHRRGPRIDWKNTQGLCVLSGPIAMWGGSPVCFSKLSGVPFCVFLKPHILESVVVLIKIHTDGCRIQSCVFSHAFRSKSVEICGKIHPCFLRGGVRYAPVSG